MSESIMSTVAEVAERRGVSTRAIQKQLKTHEKELAGHVITKNGKLWMDEYAIGLLEKAANNSAPAIVEDAKKEELEELKAELEKLKDERERDQNVIRDMAASMTKILEQHNEDVKLIAESKLYIEQRDNLQEKLNDTNEALRELKEEYDYEREKRAEAEDELAKLRNRSLLQRIFNK